MGEPTCHRKANGLPIDELLLGLNDLVVALANHILLLPSAGDPGTLEDATCHLKATGLPIGELLLGPLDLVVAIANTIYMSEASARKRAKDRS